MKKSDFNNKKEYRYALDLRKQVRSTLSRVSGGLTISDLRTSGIDKTLLLKAIAEVMNEKVKGFRDINEAFRKRDFVRKALKDYYRLAGAKITKDGLPIIQDLRLIQMYAGKI